MKAPRPLPFLPPPRLPKLQRKAVHPVADHGVFRVERHQYAGLPRDVFVFQCSDWCNVIAETEAGELVMIWQYRFGTDTVTLEVPGGVIDEGEDPETAAIRELREETGYEAKSFELLSVVEPNPAMQGNRCYTYLARGARLVGPTQFDDLEDIEVALVSTKHVPELLDAGHVTHALVVSALETWLRRTRR